MEKQVTRHYSQPRARRCACLLFSLQLHQPTMKYSICVICVTWNCLPPGANTPPFSLTPSLKRTSKCWWIQSSSQAPRENVKKWLRDSSRNVSYWRPSRPTGFLYWFIYLFLISLLSIPRSSGGKEARWRVELIPLSKQPPPRCLWTQEEPEPSTLNTKWESPTFLRSWENSSI